MPGQVLGLPPAPHFGHLELSQMQGLPGLWAIGTSPGVLSQPAHPTIQCPRFHTQPPSLTSLYPISLCAQGGAQGQATTPSPCQPSPAHSALPDGIQVLSD